MYILTNKGIGQVIKLPPYGLGSNLYGLGDISATDYINWVKRSLNRRFGIKLPMGSSTSEDYRQAVRRFQFEVGLWANGEVDSATQNKLIKANESNPNYMEWVQKALNKTGAELAVNKRKDKNTEIAIKGFQAYSAGVYKDLKLKSDGFVGAKTETALIRTLGGCPPNCPPGRDEPKIKPKNPDIELIKRLENMPIAGLDQNPKVRERINCIRNKVVAALKGHKPLDDFYYYSEPPYKKYLIQEVRQQCFGKEGTKLAHCFKKLHNEVLDLINRDGDEINRLINVLGVLPNMKSPECERGRFFIRKANSQNSIYWCFRSIILPTFRFCIKS